MRIKQKNGANLVPFTSPENWHKMSCSNFPQIFLTASNVFCGPRNSFHSFLMAWLVLAQLRQWISACCFCFWKYLGKLYVFKFSSINANYLSWRDQNYIQFFSGSLSLKNSFAKCLLTYCQMDTIHKPSITVVICELFFRPRGQHIKITWKMTFSLIRGASNWEQSMMACVWCIIANTWFRFCHF